MAMTTIVTIHFGRIAAAFVSFSFRFFFGHQRSHQFASLSNCFAIHFHTLPMPLAASSSDFSSAGSVRTSPPDFIAATFSSARRRSRSRGSDFVSGADLTEARIAAMAASRCGRAAAGLAMTSWSSAASAVKRPAGDSMPAPRSCWASVRAEVASEARIDSSAAM